MRMPRLLVAVALAVAIPVLLAGPASAAKHVTVTDFSFSPAKVRIHVGGTVVWDFQARHTTTSNHGLWDSGVKHAGQSFRHTFHSAGTFRYHCTLHPEMTGKVVVVAARPHPARIREAAHIVAW